MSGALAVSSAYTRRLESYLEHLYLMATTFSALTLHERLALGDTLLSLTCSFLSRSAGALFLDQGAGLASGVLYGPLDDALLAQGAPLWSALAAERAAQVVSPTRLPEALRAVPAFACGMAAVAITLDDRAAALLIVGAAADEDPFGDADLSFLTAAAGIGALSFASAAAINAQQQLAQEKELAAEKARRETEEKSLLLKELDQKLAIIDNQHQQILALSSPILEVWRGVLLLPIIGAVDERRGAEIMARLLSEVVAKHATYVIMDVTAAEVVSGKAADQLVHLIAAVRLLGTRGIITGIRPAVAELLVSLGADLSSIVTLRSLEDGLKLCMQKSGPGAGATGGDTLDRERVDLPGERRRTR